MVNDVSHEGVGFDSDRNAVTIITQSEVIEVPETTKWEVAQRVLDQVAKLRKVAQPEPPRPVWGRVFDPSMPSNARQIWKHI